MDATSFVSYVIIEHKHKNPCLELGLPVDLTHSVSET